MKARYVCRGLFGLAGMSLWLNLSCLPATSGEPGPRPTASATADGALAVLAVGQSSLEIELACTPAQQQQGLMYRQQLPENQGMLFVFDRAQPLNFWMKNTYVPLSIAYLDSEGRIVDIQDMQPLDETTHPSSRPARYALEVNQGWFLRHKVAVGEQIRLDSYCSHP